MIVIDLQVLLENDLPFKVIKILIERVVDQINVFLIRVICYGFVVVLMTEGVCIIA